MYHESKKVKLDTLEKEKSLNEQKRIIQTYVKNITVFKDK
jgi:hypothetical protein